MNGGPTVAVIQARMTSTRLPRKVLLPLAGESVLAHVVRRVRAIPGVDRVCAAIPVGAEHEPVCSEARRLGIEVSRGPEADVLRRTRLAADSCGARRVVRVTSDCPLLDPEVAGRVLHEQTARGVPYASTALDHGYPIGLDVEAFDAAALRDADDHARDVYEREHVTPYLWRRPARYPTFYLDREPDRRSWRLALDTPEDYEVITAIIDRLGVAAAGFGFDAIEALLTRQPELLRPSRGVVQTPYETSLNSRASS